MNVLFLHDGCYMKFSSRPGKKGATTHASLYNSRREVLASTVFHGDVSKDHMLAYLITKSTSVSYGKG
jgi:hypothetical protein